MQYDTPRFGIRVGSIMDKTILSISFRCGFCLCYLAIAAAGGRIHLEVVWTLITVAGAVAVERLAGKPLAWPTAPWRGD